MNITEMLDTLAEYQAQKDSLELDKQSAIDSILTPEIKAQLDAIEMEFASKAIAVNENIAELEGMIKSEVLIACTTVKGAHFMAVYNKGRVTWDSKKLDGMMALIPGLEAARKEGEPSVTIRKV